LITLFTCGNRAPRPLGVLLAFVTIVGIIFAMGVILLQAVHLFAVRQDTYRTRMEELLESIFELVKTLQAIIPLPKGVDSELTKTSRLAQVQVYAADFLEQVSVTSLIINLLGSVGHVLEDLVYIILFLVFLLLGHGDQREEEMEPTRKAAQEQIFTYISGKSGISAFIAIAHASVLWYVGLELWLSFGAVTFFLNFIPAVGGLVAMLLPMPLIVLDTKFESVAASVAFFVPFVFYLFAKDVLEPMVIGKRTSLSPVTVLLAIIIYSKVWGVTGMVMAVPMTAVMRIYLESVNHPLTQYAASLLSGERATSPDRARDQILL